MISRKVITVLVAAGFGIFAAGCSTSVPTDDLESKLSSSMEEEVGVAPDEVDCPDELPAEKGETVRCTLTSEDLTYGITVTASEVDGNDVDITFEVDEEPES